MPKQELEYRMLELSEHLPHSRGISLPGVDGYSQQDMFECIKYLVERKLIMAKYSNDPGNRGWHVQGLTAAGHRELKSQRSIKRQASGRMRRIDWKWGIGFAIPAATAIVTVLYLGVE